jgi:hypothetical protein
MSFSLRSVCVWRGRAATSSAGPWWVSISVNYIGIKMLEAGQAYQVSAIQRWILVQDATD